MKKLLLITISVLIMGCCENETYVKYKVVEKISTQNRDGNIIYYYVLLDNGTQEMVNVKDYVNVKVGEYWYVRECK